jgi:hypothetical protein
MTTQRLDALEHLHRSGEYLNQQQMDELFAEVHRLREIVGKLQEALIEISEGSGPYNRDQQQHLLNCFEHGKKIAIAAIAAAEGKGT